MHVVKMQSKKLLKKKQWLILSLLLKLIQSLTLLLWLLIQLLWIHLQQIQLLQSNLHQKKLRTSLFAGFFCFIPLPILIKKPRQKAAGAFL